MSSPPNIILILADDMGFSDIGCFGSEIDTPHLDKLGFGGLRFSQLYNSARCCPSRASLLTGLSPQEAGVGHMVDDWGVGPAYQGWLREDTITIAEALAQGGYQTFYSGKWHVNHSFEPSPGEPADLYHHKLGQSGYPHPMQRGFNQVYALMTGATSLFNPQHLVKQDQWVTPNQPGYYITDVITDEAIEMIDQHETNGNSEQPFFLHLCHIAPHWPLHAYAEDIEKYKDYYQVGWDEIRKRRHQSLQSLGLIDEGWRCSDRDPYAAPWSTLSIEQQTWEASRMAAYAAMVDRLDQSVGRLIQCLQSHDKLDNTLIVFLSDNGGCAEFLQEDGWCQWYGHPTWDGREVRLGNDMDITPGPDDTFMSYGLPWANASNTPFRLFKHFVHEGGIATPAIFHWPKQLNTPGQVCHSPCHIQDILPTLLDIAGLDVDTLKDGTKQLPNGESFAAALHGNPWQRQAPICFEHEGNAAIRSGKWKAVRRFPDNWELYDMDCDRTELNDLSEIHPNKLMDMMNTYQLWAESAGVKPWPPGDWPSWMDNEEFKAG